MREGNLGPHSQEALMRHCDQLPGELWGLPETVHVDALGCFVLPLAVLLEPNLLVHAQSMDRCSGLHKRPNDKRMDKHVGQ